MFEADLSAPVVNAGLRTSNPRELSERVAMGRALWRELVIGFASQLGRIFFQIIEEINAKKFGTNIALPSRNGFTGMRADQHRWV